MITCSQIGKIGRFGNQMFQYATAFAVAQKNKYTLGMPYKNRNSQEYLDFCLPDCFPFLSAIDISDKTFANIYSEKSFQFDSELYNITDNTDISGYFQSWKYFEQYELQIRAEFRFASKYYAQANSVKNGRNKEYIALHIRFGDYTWNTNYHPICDIDYYRRGLDCIPNVKDKKILLFSDDINAAQSTLENLKYECIQTNDKFLDMCLMTLCDYHVISNSTFCWWGAYLSNSKQVIAPKKWFGPDPSAPPSWDDIYCRNWTIL